MKLDAGGKPWRRKPSAPPAVSAASTPALVAVERERDHRQGRGRDHADAGGEPVDAVDEVDDVDHGDDPDDRQQLAEVDLADAAAGSKRSTERGVDAADEGQRERGQPDAVEDGDRARRRSGRGASTAALSVTDVVDHPERRDHGGAGEDPARLGARRAGRARRRRGSPTRIASPPSFGVGAVWRLRSFGLVDRADPAGEPLADRDQEPGEHGREQEPVEARRSGIWSSVDEHRSVARREHRRPTSGAGVAGVAARRGFVRRLSELERRPGRASSRSRPSAISRSSTAPISPLKIV